MVEWYRVGAPYETVMDDTRGACRARRPAPPGATTLAWRGRTADPFAAAERLTVADAFRRHAGIDLLATLATTATAWPARRRAGPESASRTDDTWSDIFSRILVEKVEPALGYRPPDAPRRIPGRPRRRLLASVAATTRASPSASSSMPAASSSPTASPS